MLRASHLLFFTLMIGASLHGQQSELRTLANGLAEDIAASGKKTIAVVDFTDLQGNATELGRFLAEELSVALTRTHKGFEVVDRAHLKAILTEHKLAASGLIDPATAKKLGQMTGADVLMTGTMTPFSESVRVTVKVLATDTARIIAADTTDLPKTTTITELLGNSIGGAGNSARRNDRPTPSNRPSEPVSGSAFTGPPPTSPVVVSAQFQYELLECRGMATSVKCNLRITNRGPDRRLFHLCGFNKTKAFDNFGNESRAESCTITNKSAWDGYEVEVTLISGITVQATVAFGNISASASTLSLLSIVGMSAPVGGFGGQEVSVGFRNVPIVR